MKNISIARWCQLICLFLVSGVIISCASSGTGDEDTAKAPWVDGRLKRFATTAAGAEVTGPLLMPNGNIGFSLQHPSRDNTPPFNKAGVVLVQNFDLLEDDFDSLSIPEGREEQEKVRSASGNVDILVGEGTWLSDEEKLGIAETPDEKKIDTFHGSRYFELGYIPDMNQFVSTSDDDRKGYLYTNFENSPGNISRVPLVWNGHSWNARLSQGINLANKSRYREIGGSRINCYGEKTHWGTFMSAEEDYSHPYLSSTHTIEDFMEEGSGKGLLGAGHFWNRPNPKQIQNALQKQHSRISSWNVQGSFGLGGVELLAYYLGADPVDQEADRNTIKPITGEAYPNKYRYGYMLEVRDPSKESWSPFKYYVMGRYAPEAADVMADNKTVYLTSDGSSKGLYKFVADKPIPTYEDPMDISGSLYVASVEGPVTGPPAESSLPLEWLKLGSASNREVHQWLSEYDDVDQQDYLDLATRSDHPSAVKESAGPAETLKAADRYVIEHGNPAYITPKEIRKWKRQYKKRGPEEVDDSLRRVPFLETRIAAKSIGGTVEFRKAEGIDSYSGTTGEYVYLALSEVDDQAMSDEEGDLQLERVEGGIVYRAKIQDNYNLQSLEPAVVGPDATDPATVADDAAINIDNVLKLEDGRVLLLEDADQYGRSYPNDNLWVYIPSDVKQDQ